MLIGGGVLELREEGARIAGVICCMGASLVYGGIDAERGYSHI